MINANIKKCAMKLLIVALVFLSGCSHFTVGLNCKYAYQEINGQLEKTNLSVCEKL